MSGIGKKEVLKNLSKPKPPPSRFHSSKKGKKGYDRKRDKRDIEKELNQ